jgi:hypothetical protein
MQALKQAAREGDQVRLEAVCEEWSVSAATDRESDRAATPAHEVQAAANPVEKPAKARAESDPVIAAALETRR